MEPAHLAGRGKRIGALHQCSQLPPLALKQLGSLGRICGGVEAVGIGATGGLLHLEGKFLLGVLHFPEQLPDLGFELGIMHQSQVGIFLDLLAGSH